MSEAKILIVDDEEELRENLRDLLEFFGYEVVAASSGEEALKLFSSQDFNAALFDIQLPGIDGLELLQRIKKIQPDLPVAMVSASSVRGVLAQAEQYGADRTILKPYSPEDMRQAVEEMLAKSV